jgi:hypothetical protein
MTEIRHYEDIEEPPEVRHSRRVASAFRRDPRLERLLTLEAKAEGGNVVARDERDRLSPAERLELGFYGSARAAAVELKLVDPSTGEPKK